MLFWTEIKFYGIIEFSMYCKYLIQCLNNEDPCHHYLKVWDSNFVTNIWSRNLVSTNDVAVVEIEIEFWKKVNSRFFNFHFLWLRLKFRLTKTEKMTRDIKELVYTCKNLLFAIQETIFIKMTRTVRAGLYSVQLRSADQYPRIAGFDNSCGSIIVKRKKINWIEKHISQ